MDSSVQFSSVQSLSHVRLFATPWIAARQASLAITNSGSSLRFTSIESLMPSSHLILSRPLLLLLQSLPGSKSFKMSQLFAWGGQSTGASALASFLPKKSKGWSPSEIIREMQIKTTMRYPLNTSQNDHHQKNLQTLNSGEDEEKKETSCTAGGNVNWYSHCGKQCESSFKN